MLKLLMDEEEIEPIPKSPSTIIRERKAAEKMAKKLMALMANQQLVRDHLDRELKMAKRNRQKLKGIFRQMGVDAKMPMLRENLEIAWHNFDRVLDLKDHLISNLLNELQECENQYYFNMQAHAETIDNLLNMLYKHLSDWEKRFNEKRENLIGTWEKDSSLMNESGGSLFVQLEAMTFSMQKQHDEKMLITTSELRSRIDEETHDWIENISRFRMMMDTELGSVWNQMVTVLKNYHNNTNELKNAYWILQKRDDASIEEIHEMIDKATKSFEIIRKLKDRMVILKTTQQQKIDDLTHEKTYFHGCYVVLRNKLHADTDNDKNQIELMTMEAIMTNNYLKDLVKKGDKMCTLAAMCRKLETEKEKVLPFPFDDNSMTEKNAYEAEDLKFMENLPLMDKFWHRVAKAESKRYLLKEEWTGLARENKYLIEVLRDICIGKDKETVEAFEMEQLQMKRKILCCPKCDCVHDSEECFEKEAFHIYETRKGTNIDINQHDAVGSTECVNMGPLEKMRRLIKEKPNIKCTVRNVTEASLIYKRL